MFLLETQVRGVCRCVSLLVGYYLSFTTFGATCKAASRASFSGKSVINLSEPASVDVNRLTPRAREVRNLLPLEIYTH